MEDEKKVVWSLIHEMNKAWTEGDPCELNNYFHEKMVAITPADNERITGRENCVKGWTDFAKSTEICSWKETDPMVDIYNEDSAVVSYYFQILYNMNGVSYDIKGRDMFMLIKEEGRWWIVADQYSLNL